MRSSFPMVSAWSRAGKSDDKAGVGRWFIMVL
ncbi:hypothetical protein ACVWYV_000387 [Pantoea eucalypti]